MRPVTRYRNWISRPGRSPSSSGTGGFAAARGRYHLYVSLACPWRTAPRVHAQAQGPGRRDLDDRGRAGPWASRAGSSAPMPDPPDAVNGKEHLNQVYLHRRPALHRPRHRTGAVGQGATHDRQQRVPPKSSACSIRRSTRSPTTHRLLSGSAARARSIAINEPSSATSTTASIAPASPPRRRPMRRRSTRCSRARRAGERLSRQRYLAGTGITEADWRLFTTLAALRRRLSQPLQMQPAPHRRLPEPVELPARPLSGAGHRRDREHGPHQAPLLRQPRNINPTASCRSGRRSISTRRMTAGVSQAER